MKFHGDIVEIKIASSEDSVSKTIEELLELNDKIPQRKGEVHKITEKQFEEDAYANKGSRGEENGITEKQFGSREGTSEEILEIRLEDTPSENGGHRPEAWDMDDKKVRGHTSIPPIWHEVYKKEDKRNKSKKKDTLEREKK